MLVNNANITEKKYKKLILQVGQNGMSFCSVDTLNESILTYNEILFDTTDKTISIEKLYSKAYQEHNDLQASYDEVIVLHDNNLVTFVPSPLFDENFLGSYLQYNNKVFETDFFAFDSISSYQMNTVYIPNVTINSFMIEKYGAITYKHSNTILVSKLLAVSKNVDEKKMFVHLKEDHFEIIVVQNQNLLLYNSFEYKTPEDLIYFLLFTAEQLNLNPETFKLEFLGKISEHDEFFKIAYQYIRNVSLFDVTNLQKHNTFSTADNLKYFILFQS